MTSGRRAWWRSISVASAGRTFRAKGGEKKGLHYYRANWGDRCSAVRGPDESLFLKKRLKKMAASAWNTRLHTRKTIKMLEPGSPRMGEIPTHSVGKVVEKIPHLNKG